MIRKWYHNRIKRVVDERIDKLLHRDLRFFNLHHIDDRREDDVYIVGYPKSGTTLMQHLVAHLYFGLNENAEKPLIDLVTIDLHNHSWYPRLSERCFFKSHALPDPAYRKVIYMVRDGRDANLSLWYMQRDIIGQEYGFEEVFLNPTPFGTWGEHVMKWKANPHNADILFIRYEDLLRDKPATIDSVAAFLGLAASQSARQLAAEMTSMDHMRHLENTRLGQRYKSNRNWEAEGKFTRSGQSEAFRAEVPAGVLEAFSQQSMDALMAFGYAK